MNAFKSAVFLLLVSVSISVSAEVRYQLFQNLSAGYALSKLEDVDFDNLTPASTGVMPDFTINVTGEFFAYRYSAEFHAPSSDIYHFYLRSDDGSRLYINGELVVDNDDTHPAIEVSNSIYLTQGIHQIKVEYFERAGEEVLDLKYQTATGLATDPTSRLGLGVISQIGADFDNDGLTDFYDTLHFANCDINRLTDSRYTDFRNCDFTDKVFPVGTTVRDKNFDGANFTRTNFNSSGLTNSSFRNANFIQYEVADPDQPSFYKDPPITAFINSDFTGAVIEQHWPWLRIYNANMAGTSFFTEDPAMDTSWYCFENSTFSALNLVRYDLPTGVTINAGQDYMLGVAGGQVLDIQSNFNTSCLNNINFDTRIRSLIDNHLLDIAPHIFMKDVLNRNYNTSLPGTAVESWETGVATNTGNGNSRNYPIYGDKRKPAFRSSTAHVSPYWEWDLGRYYQIKSLRLKQDPANKPELEDATIFISDHAITGNPMLLSDYDSIARYQLGKTPTGDYKIPVNRSVRYIRIQRPKSTAPQYLSFESLELYADDAQGLTPLAGATTPLPKDYELPTFGCSLFDPALLDPNFKVATVVPDANGDLVWDYADLRGQNYNDADFGNLTFGRNNVSAVNTNFEQTQLVGADFRGVFAERANFRGANLEGANFSGAYIDGADFRGANLKGANFDGVDASCAIFSGSIPPTYTPIDEFVGLPKVSALAIDAGFGYSRASSIDEGTRTDMAIDNDINTTSVTALETSAWWELDMGAIYALKDIKLLTGLTMTQEQLLNVYVSDWPMPYNSDDYGSKNYIRQISDFSVDQNIIKFHGNQTGRYIRIEVPRSLGQLKLRLTEVTAESPGIPTSPTTAIPLSAEQISSLPNTQSLFEKIDVLIDLYGAGNALNEGVSASINDLSVLNEKTIAASYNIDKVGNNIRKALRPVAGSKFIMSQLAKAIPSFKSSIENAKDVLKIVEVPVKIASRSTLAIKAYDYIERSKLVATRSRLNDLSKKAKSQIDFLKLGRNYLRSKQRCALYGTESTAVLNALETYSSDAAAKLDSTLLAIGNQAEFWNSIDKRKQEIQVINNHYTAPEVFEALQTSEDVVTAMGPVAAALDPISLLFSKGEIYDGFTVMDILNAVAKFTSSVTNAIYDVPILGDALQFITDALSVPFNAFINEVTVPLNTLLKGALGSAIDNLGPVLTTIKNEAKLLAGVTTKTTYKIPSVNANVFDSLFTLAADSAFASCNDSLNLPPQWPAAEGDNDGDGLLNGYELSIGTLVDSPDSDKDGLSDKFETQWNDQAPNTESKFQANNAVVGELERDTDDDGLTAVEEYANGTNPFSADTDNDGITDDLEVLFGTNPLSDPKSPSDLDLDLDGDGVTIRQELAFGFDVLDPADIEEDHDGDGVSSYYEVRALQTSPRAAAPVVLANKLILEVAGDQITTIDSRNFYVSNGENITIDPAQLRTSEGTLALNGSYTLELTPVVGKTIEHDIDIYFKLVTPNGNEMVHLIVRKASVDDVFPFDPNETTDTDGDGIGNNADTDDDNDGVFDVNDAFPLDATEFADFDLDGIGNNSDTDDDNDGVPDVNDAFPLNANESLDTDGDGIGNAADTDDDNDGVLDANDVFPLDATETVDTDNDGIGNNADTDDDNDGVLDVNDAFPLDSRESADSDGDGFGDISDAFPNDSTESADFDNDGYGDNKDQDDDNDGLPDLLEISLGLNPENGLDAVLDLDADNYTNILEYLFGSEINNINSVPSFSLLADDSDGDGVPDSVDTFVLDASEFIDTDADGIGNNEDADDDGDGVTDSLDAFELDVNESVDSDSDGVGDNADAFPLDPAESMDTDVDGVGNNTDLDDDSDGILDTEDAFPLDSTESVDTDGDLVGDISDAFPEDPTESVDTDQDGVGNNADTDDDGDGVDDINDAFPLDSSETLDSDGDLVGDNADSFPFDASRTEEEESGNPETADSSDNSGSSGATGVWLYLVMIILFYLARLKTGPRQF